MKMKKTVEEPNKRFVDKLIERLEKEILQSTEAKAEAIMGMCGASANAYSGEVEAYNKAIKITKDLASEHNNGWISVEDALPKIETTVLIHAKRKYKDGSFKDIITTAMYEDGTVLEDDSCWRWEDIDGEWDWDEENDCHIIPEGWWEDKKYNEDGELNHVVDDEVIEWQPLPGLPTPYKKEE